MKWVAYATMMLLSCHERRAVGPPAPHAASGGRLTAFTCDGPRCTQRHPRMPDDGEWTCADAAGAALCVGGEPAAGVAPGPADPSWHCGPRRKGRPDALGARVCTDSTPDFPDGRMAGWRCRYIHDPPPRRACDRDPNARTLSEPCDPQRPCIDGGWCRRGVCALPPSPPDCWLDGDCGGGRCRLGHCDEARP